MLLQRFTLNEIPLPSNGAPSREVQVLRVGKFNHPEYGQFEITPLVLAEMVKNFQAKIRGVDLAIDYYHASDKDAAGWISDLQLREEGQELWAIIDWTPSAQKKLSDRELRYFSPDFTFVWKDPESGQKFSNVLFGGGLTNRPFVKEMAPIVAAEIKGKSMKTIIELEAENKKLSEQLGEAEKKMADMVPAPAAGGEDKDAIIAQLKKEIEEMKSKMELSEQEKSKAEAEKKMAEKSAAFNLLLSEGKVVAAQKDSFLKDDMQSFIKLAQPLNSRAGGSSQGAGEDEVEAEEDKVIKLAEVFRKENPSMSIKEATVKAMKQVKGNK